MSPDDSLYAPARRGLRPEDCDFYHSMEIPGVGVVEGSWDLRGREREYLGGVDVAGKHVLEVGPASGFLTMTLERAGASVVAIETHPDAPWDMVPQHGIDLAGNIERRRLHMERIRNSWWLVHERFELQARVHYGHGEEVPAALGSFDVAVLAAVLLHCRHPLDVLEAAATRAGAVVVTDLHAAGVTGPPALRLVPSHDNRITDTWWFLTPEIVCQFLGVLGFDAFDVTTHEHRDETGKVHPFFTVVARR
jgi:O-methyltransferase